MVLSGMNSHNMVAENIRTASETEVSAVTEEERAVYAQVVDAINESTKVGCTGCGYCQPCPKGVDIPGTFAAYNRYYSESKFSGLKEHLMTTGLRKTSTDVSNCVGCGKCEQHCPQGIQIRQELKNAEKVLEGPIYQVAKKVVGWFAHF